MELIETGADNVRWDLSHLYASSEEMIASLSETQEMAASFAERYRGQVARLTVEDFAKCMQEAGAIQDRIGRAYSFAYMDWVTDTRNVEKGAALQKVKEAYASISQSLVFFDLEWSMADDARAESILKHPEIASYRHYLELIRLQKEHLLSEPEEIILSEKNVTGASSWVRYFDETLSSMTFSFRGEEVTQQALLAKLHDSDRNVRKDAALSFTEGLKARNHSLTFVFNTLLADKASTDRLRNYDSWISSRNVANEVSDEAVESLVTAVTDRYDIVERFYNLKKKLLKIDDFADYDRYAPVGESDKQVSWTEARDLVATSYREFNPEFGSIVDRFFDEQWIDAAVVEGKRSGAFSHGVVPSAHPYILMNYTGKIRDVQTLAHELGHGVHQYLSRQQGIFHADTPLTTAETASVFGEMLVFQRLLAAEEDPRNRLAMLVSKIDDTIATVFRQIAMNRFENEIHGYRRTEGELSPDMFAEKWIATQENMFRGSVSLSEHYRYWWSYIPHFLHTPGYVYAYAFGELLVLALYARYVEEGEAFSKKYYDLLAAGGSDWPHILVGKLGVDLTDDTFWQQGLQAIDDLVAEAEELASANL